MNLFRKLGNHVRRAGEYLIDRLCLYHDAEEARTVREWIVIFSRS